MLKNYFKIAIRNITRQPLFSFINIFGLALSMSICLLVMLRTKDQLSYDTFHPHPERTYRIISDITNKQGSQFTFATSPLPLAVQLQQQYNFIEKTVRLYPAGKQNATTGKKKITLNNAFTDASFFDLFGFKLAQGNAATALQAPNSIVLSQAAAVKFFGSTNAIGQLLYFDRLGTLQVTGILADTKNKSHIDFEGYVSMSTVSLLEKSGKLTPNLEVWNTITLGYTYLLLKEKATQGQLAAAVKQQSEALMKQSGMYGKEKIIFKVQPLKAIILGEEMMYNLGNVGSLGKVLAEVAIAFIILLAAAFNYTNLSIARSLKRGKEVGIRKVSGAGRPQLFAQFIIESILIAVLSLVLAGVLLKLMIDYNILDAEFVNGGFSIDGSIVAWSLLFAVFTGLLAGALPAWALSSFKTVEVLKNLSNIKLFLGNGFRKALIVGQFTLSLVIIIFTITFFRQFSYMASLSRGFNADNLVTIPLQGADYPVLLHDVLQLNGVQQAAGLSDVPGRYASGQSAVKLQAGREPFAMNYYDTDTGFLACMQLPLIAGTNFPVYTGAERYVLINEKAVQLLKVPSPAAAIGTTIWLDTMQVQIAGVVKDFNYNSMALPVLPLLLRNRPANFNFLAIRTATGQSPSFMQGLKNIWQQHNPRESFSYQWLAQDLYARDNPWEKVSILGLLSFMAITIASLGLLGMVVYTTETRRKEIGIRKVMGAGVTTIINLLTGSFLKLLLIAGAIALPAGYLLGYFFLNMFANRITMQLDIPLLGLGVVFLIALLTIGAYVYKAAMSNPVENLRVE